jgi:hypothetical protein
MPFGVAVTAMNANARSLACLLAQCEADIRFCARHSQVAKAYLIC